MKSMRYVFILVLILITIGAVGCSDTAGNAQITGLINEISGLRNSLNSTQQELAAAKQSLQDIKESPGVQSTQSSVEQTVIPAVAAPVIVNFSITPGSITSGQKAILQWYVKDASTVSISHGIGTVSCSGSRAVYPGTTTTYTLTAYGCCNSVSSSATVTVMASSCRCGDPCYYLAYPYDPVIRYVYPVIPRPAPVPPPPRPMPLPYPPAPPPYPLVPPPPGPLPPPPPP